MTPTSAGARLGKLVAAAALGLPASACGGRAYGCLPGADCEVPFDVIVVEPPDGVREVEPPEPGARVCDGVSGRGIMDQLGIDALEGCQAIDGDLLVRVFPQIDLRPLSALEQVRGTFTIRGPTGTARLGVTRDLSGLEGLRSVGSLVIDNTSVATLAALEGLRSVGTLRIERCYELTNLDGLGGLRELDAVHVEDNDVLVTLAGLALPRELGRLTVDDNPALSSLGPVWPVERIGEVAISRSALSDIGALSNVVEIDSIELSRPGPLATLRGLSSLRSVGSLSASSTALVSLEGLEALRSAGSVRLSGRLRDASALANLETLSRLSVTQTRELVALPAFGRLASEEVSLEIARNADLRRGPALLNVTHADSLHVAGNAELEAFALPRLRTAGSVRIVDNAGLEALDLGDLSSVQGELNVSCNELLSSDRLSTLEGVDAERTVLLGNGEADASCAPGAR